MQGKPIGVAIVEDNPDDRTLLELMLVRLKGLRFVMCYAAGEEALKSPAMVETHVVLMDIRMPGMGGIACTRLLKKVLPGLIILMVTGMDEPGMLREAILAGADGFLSKPLSDGECWEAISASSPGAKAALTAQQKAVAKCMEKGMANKQIAAELGLSMSGTKKTIHAIFVKLEVSSRVEVVNRLHGRIL
jgi:DNA-binding NarL/FixJ family response regulator